MGTTVRHAAALTSVNPSTGDLVAEFDEHSVDEVERRLPTIAPEERRANVEALITMAREYLAADPAGTAAGFDGWVAAGLRHDAGGDTGDAVDVVTFHRAKGLEWPVVYVCGLERGLVPIGRAESGDERAEERRTAAADSRYRRTNRRE